MLTGRAAVAGLAAGASGGALGADLAGDLAFAIEIAERAGRLLMERYERVGQISRKSPKDVVTEVDHLSEELIIAAIRERDPDDAVLAEESGEHHGRAAAATSGRGRVWVLDPLDGTVNYANGLPIFCVSVALVVEGLPAVGVVHDPTRAETLAATADGAPTLNGRPIRASVKTDLADCVVSLAIGGRRAPTRVRAIRKAIRVSRSMGSSALALAYVGNGRFDAMIQSGGLSAWDIAAAGLIAERAGALLTAMDGGPWFDLARKPRSAGIVAGPPAIHGPLTALLG
ncbi:MAG TPA: inositol monophosphatase family protein [Candidatus Limnocylindrales bacterium]